MSRPELQRQIVGLMTYRVVVITTLLISMFIIELFFRPAVTLKPFYYLGVLTYLLCLGYAFSYRWFKNRPWFVPFQLVGDLIVVTGLVYVSGGPGSPFSFLYLILIITAAILLYRRGGLLIAAAAWLLYAVLVEAVYFRLLPVYPQEQLAETDLSVDRILYLLFSHLFSFLTVAYLTSYMSEKLRRADETLVAKEKDLDELRAFNEDIIESINSGMIATTLNGAITFSNRAASEITGFTGEELSSKTISALLGTDEAFQTEVRAALETRNRYRFERDFSPRQGSALFLGFTVSILRNKEGVPLGLIFIFQDLTDIKALEEEVALKKRMAALGEMAAGMAHELRNPLASISGSVQVLKGELPLDREQEDLMNIIIKESRRLDHTIRDFLAFAKPGPFNPEPVDLSDIISDSLKLLRNSDEFRSTHQLRVQFHPQRIPVMVDSNRMRQVLWNLSKNALKAMPEGGTLTIKALGEVDGQVLVSFADEGAGMPEEDVSRNFQPFHGSFQKGTGLGLAIVYRIVQEHGGRIRIKSKMGSGTEVQILLPKSLSEPVETGEGESWIAY